MPANPYEPPRSDTPAGSESASPLGCFFPLLASAWIVGVTFVVPISADRYQAPAHVKWAVTSGHSLAVILLLLPYRGRGCGNYAASALATAWALVSLMTLWTWNS